VVWARGLVVEPAIAPTGRRIPSLSKSIVSLRATATRSAQVQVCVRVGDAGPRVEVVAVVEEKLAVVVAGQREDASLAVGDGPPIAVLLLEAEVVERLMK